MIVLQVVPQMRDELFQTFRGEEVPLFTTFYHTVGIGKHFYRGVHTNYFTLVLLYFGNHLGI